MIKNDHGFVYIQVMYIILVLFSKNSKFDFVEYFQFLIKILLKEFALSTKFQSLFEGEYFLPG